MNFPNGFVNPRLVSSKKHPETARFRRPRPMPRHRSRNPLRGTESGAIIRYRLSPGGAMSFGDIEPSEPRRGEALSGPPHLVPHVTFERGELDQILGLYGRKVAEGEWRDYAIDFLKDRAVFSVFRRASEIPIYRIEKNPRLSRRQG